MKRVLLIALCAVLLLGTAGCSAGKWSDEYQSELDLRAAVLYDGASSDLSWEDVYSRLDQSLLLCFSVEAVDVSKDYDLSKYNILYPDETIMNAKNASVIKEKIVDFTQDGGSVFLTNGFYSFFDKSYIGAKKFEKINSCPTELKATRVGEDLGELQEIVLDFASLYEAYDDYETLSSYDYGYGMKTGSAKAIIKYGKLALYTMNEYGKGYVFFTSKLLPNVYSINGYSMESRSGAQETFANSTASANALLENTFASYVAKKTFGYSIWRTFGSFGGTDMAWELHYEEITGIEKDSAILFGELCKEYQQVPSYTLVRNSYQWFLRSETVTYLLGSAENGTDKFSMDLYENAYSSGKHVASNGKWISLYSIESGGSYFEDYPEYDQRAYPYLTDYDKDGVTDILCGSADGTFYFYRGTGFGENFETEEVRQLTDSVGEVISVSSYSAPVMVDVNRDGKRDIVSGSADGEIYWFSGNGDLTFEPEGLLISTAISGQSLPDIGDLDGDGALDLVIGSNEGVLIVFYGENNETNTDKISFSTTNAKNFSGVVSENIEGLWIAPRVVDINGDGVNDIIAGTVDGYIAKLIANEDGLSFDGYIQSNEMNYKGNYNVKIGNNCVPCLRDINGDGVKDLVCGSLEYGLAYPIDSEYFPYASKLQNQIKYIQDNNFYIGMHFLTTAYSSPERESAELEMHKRALSSYNINTSGIGANQHTWFTSSLSSIQSFAEMFKSGLLWNSGFRAPGADYDPQSSSKNVISLPFFLTDDGKETILIQNCSTLPYSDESWTDISAKYGMPVSVYYHCDFVYRSEDDARANIERVQEFREKHGYNFVGEDQMMQAVAAEYNLTLSVSDSPDTKSGKFGVTLTPGTKTVDYPLFDRYYQSSCGARISFSENLNVKRFATDADVWYRDGNNLYVSLNREITLYSTGHTQKGDHLEKVNFAALLEETEDGMAVKFADNGMMQVVVDGRASTDNEGWDVVRQDGKTTFTKYGTAETLNIKF